MQHIRTAVPYFEAHNTLWRAVKYLSLMLAGLIAVFEHSPALLIVLAIAYALVLALFERVRKHDSASYINSHASASRILGDGGCFPGAVPEEEMSDSRLASVLDGGSLEHHGS
jgi:hypothetical protein